METKTDDELWEESLRETGELEDEQENEQQEDDQTQETQDVEEVENVQEEDVENEDEQDDQTQADQTQADQEQEQEQDYDDQYTRGKTRREIVEINRHATRKITSQENELNKLRDQVSQLIDLQKQSVKQTQEPEPEKSDVEKYLDDIDPQDQEAVALLLNRELDRREQHKQKLEQEMMERTEGSNQSRWKSIRERLLLESPEYVDPLFNKMNEEIQNKGRSQTLLQEDWVTNFVLSELPKLNRGEQKTLNRDTPNNETIIKKKKRASTAGSSQRTDSTANKWKGKPEPEDPEEYAQWYEGNYGKKI